MREIKFRAWDREDKRMLSWDDLFTLSITFDGGLYGIIKSSRYTKMQYSGLNADGKEIYEGDVVEYENPIRDVIEVGIVTWGVAGFGINSPTDGGIWNGDSIKEVKKVLGNIYENPELVKD